MYNVTELSLNFICNKGYGFRLGVVVLGQVIQGEVLTAALQGCHTLQSGK